MEHKGYLTETGRVVRKTTIEDGVRFAQDGDMVIGMILLREDRYNLRRVFVNYTWIVKVTHGDRAGERFTGSTRQEAVDAALRSGAMTTTRRPLTSAERDVMGLLRENGGFGMTTRELADAMDLTPDGVKSHLAPLRYSGYITRTRLKGNIYLWTVIEGE